MAGPRRGRLQLHAREHAKRTGMAFYEMLLSILFLISWKFAVDVSVDCI
jgi:hypothetical protein